VTGVTFHARNVTMT